MIEAVRWMCVLVCSAGCYGPSPQPGAPCANGACPDGLVCAQLTRTCERLGDDAGLDATRVIDAHHDAAKLDAAGDAPSVGTTPMVLQQVANSAAAGASLSVTLTPPGAGHLLIMTGGAIHGGLTSVVGGGVASWTRAVRSIQNTNVEIWFGITDGSGSTVTIAMPTNTAQPIWLVVSEWSGVTATLDGTSSSAGIVSPASAGVVTTTNPHDLLIFAVGDAVPNTFGAPGPQVWTAMTGVASDVSQGEWYRVVSLAGTHGPQVSETGSNWDAAVAGFQIP